MKASIEIPAALTAGLASSFSLTEKLAASQPVGDRDEHKQAVILTSGLT